MVRVVVIEVANAWICAIACCAGCTGVVSELVVKDPNAVSVRIPDSAGSDGELLPAGGAPIEVELPRDSPAYTQGVMFTASAIRRERGGITLRCDACTGTPSLDVLGDDGHVTQTREWNDVATPLLVVHGDTAVIRHLEYPYSVSTGRTVSHQVAFAVDLVTPTANLVSARRDGGETHTAGYAMLGGAAALLATSVAMFVVASGAQSGQHIAFDELGALTGLWGLCFAAGGAVLVTHPTVHEVAWPPGMDH